MTLGKVANGGEKVITVILPLAFNQRIIPQETQILLPTFKTHFRQVQFSESSREK
jgi:hypothetical protein